MSAKFFIISTLLALAAARIPDNPSDWEQHEEYPVFRGPLVGSTNLRWGTVRNVGTAFPTSVIIIDENSSNYHGCVGVPISKQHVLVSSSCRVDLTQKLLAVAAGAVNWDQEDSFREVKKVDMVGKNLAVVTLQEEIREDILIYSLPEEDPQQGGYYLAFGWSPVCLPVAKAAKRTFMKDILVLDEKDCRIRDPSLACAQGFSLKVGTGSPIVSGSTIYGFTDYECSRKGVISKVFPFIDAIRNIEQN